MRIKNWGTSIDAASWVEVAYRNHDSHLTAMRARLWTQEQLEEPWLREICRLVGASGQSQGTG